MTSSTPGSISISGDTGARPQADESSHHETQAPPSPQPNPPRSQRGNPGRIWVGRVAGFFFTVLELCALGALLGAIIFPLVGPWGGLHKSKEEMILLGARTGGFFFMVWAPGVALVRSFIRAARAKTALGQS